MLCQRQKLISASLCFGIAACQPPKDERTIPPQVQDLGLIKANLCSPRDDQPPQIDSTFRIEAMIEEVQSNDGLLATVAFHIGEELRAVQVVQNSVKKIILMELSSTSLNDDFKKTKVGDLLNIRGQWDADHQRILAEKTEIRRLSDTREAFLQRQLTADKTYSFVVRSVTWDPKVIIVQKGFGVFGLSLPDTYTPENLQPGDYVQATITDSNSDFLQSSEFRVIDRIWNCHEKPRTLSGDLSFIRRRPHDDRDQYAIRVAGNNEMARLWIPKSNDSDYADNQIQELLAQAWSRRKQGRINYPGYQINRQIQITVRGTLEIGPNTEPFAKISVKNEDDIQLPFPRSDE